MCNIPCELCGDSEDCDLYFNQLKILEKLNGSEKKDLIISEKESTNLD